MCEDCISPLEISRRRFIWVGSAGLAASLATRTSAQAGQSTVDGICRAAWGARDATDNYSHHDIHRLTIHHSGTVFRDNRQAPARFRSMQQNHQAEGWPDIAYHFLIDRHGNIYRARPTWARGNTRTNYNPRGHLLVMCIGNFEKQNLPHPQLRAAIDVLAWACGRFGVAPNTIAGHRDYASTACPGADLYSLIDDGTIRHRVRRRLDEVRVNHLCGRAGRRRVRAIEQGED
jgi:N-acetylmuramoyl-L-alanine amidase